MHESSNQLLTQNANANKIFFPNLDGLRFFSFLVVFLTHVFGGKYTQIIEPIWYEKLRIRLFSEGSTIGVSFFFVLSGFLITYLLLKEKELTNKVHVRSFYIRRILRIWPLYYLIVFYGFVLTPILKPLVGKSIVETASPLLCSLFMNNFNAIWNGSPMLTAIAVLWSVAIEEQFYIIWPLLFAHIKKIYYLYIFLGVIFLSTLFRLIFYKDQMYIEQHTLGVIADMALGGLGAYLILFHPNFKKTIEQLPKGVLLIPYLFVVLLFFFKYEMFFQISWLFILKRVIISFFFCWIILEQNFSLNSAFKVGKFKIISQLGKYTYGLYCLHPIVISFMSILLLKLNLLNQIWQVWLIHFPISLMLSIIVSYLSFRFFESPFIRLKSKYEYISKS